MSETIERRSKSGQTSIKLTPTTLFHHAVEKKTPGTAETNTPLKVKELSRP